MSKNTQDKICEFLNVPSQTMSTNLKKLNPTDYENYILNCFNCSSKDAYYVSLNRRIMDFERESDDRRLVKFKYHLSKKDKNKTKDQWNASVVTLNSSIGTVRKVYLHILTFYYNLQLI